MIQTYQGVLDGSLESDWKYGGSLDYWLKFDFEKMGLWPGAFVELRAETQFGEFINSDTGSILATNTDGFFPLPDEHLTTLSHVVFTQFLSESFGVYVLVKGQWDHCRTAEYTIKVIEKSIHGTASDDETTTVSNRELCPDTNRD